MLSSLFNQVRDAVNQHADEQQGGMNAGGLIGVIEQLFTQHAANTGQSILPASQDPYGDPGQQRILPASQDPYGDPADRAAGILPASADPYGDPANPRR
jgi:hypothetical protein